MSLTPFTKDMLRQLKEDSYLAAHCKRIIEQSNTIYRLVIRFAMTTKYTMYYYEIDLHSKDIVHDIIFELNKLFPDCIVKHTVLTRGVDGYMYEASLGCDPKGVRLQTKQFHKEYITIDWS